MVVIRGQCETVRLLHLLLHVRDHERLKIVKLGVIVLRLYLCSITSRSTARLVISCGPGTAQVDWKSCICTPAQEAAKRGRGTGHLLVFRNTCQCQLWQTTF